jgi:hypothetical protein
MADSANKCDETKYDPVANSRHCCYISDSLYHMCQSGDSVSSLIAADPDLTPADAWLKLIQGRQFVERDSEGVQTARKDSKSDQALDRARACGKWGPTEPSDLFLKVSFP